jgi:prepilin-type N-terminal cleavage/methylation domain-containing protein
MFEIEGFYRLKRRAFTLLEILLVLLILSFGIALTGVKVQELYNEQRFLSETEQILSHLSLARDLMLIMNTDVTVKLSQNEQEKTIDLWLEVEKPLKKEWQRLVQRKMQLHVFRSFSFKGESAKNVALRFSLGSMSKGILAFQEEKDTGRSFEVELTGHPTHFSKKMESNEREQINNHQILYPVEVYEEMHKDDKKS